MWAIVFYCVLFACAVAEERESRLVQTAQGPVRGYKDNENDIFEFLSIPYATAPTGKDRFKAPLPPPTWVQPLEATDKGIICHQRDIGVLSKELLKREDCLLANVYVPAKNTTNIPVVVYVHGGGFIMGHGNFINPKKFTSNKNIIVVTFNYRLAAHGFLCLGTDDIPGNAGMKDQVALLRWVKENVANFGGNPDDVTIAGYSAGSASVELLMVSKMARGLFKRVIPESGASTAAFSVQSDPIQNAKEYAELLNFDNVDDIYALEEFFKSIPLERLNSADLMNRQNSMFLVSPCVERKSKEDSFLEDSPVDILKAGDYDKLPMLYGFTNMEGLLRLALFETWMDQMNENFSDFLPADLHFENEEHKQIVAKKIKQFYFGDERVGPQSILAFIDYFSDVIFTYPALRSIKLHVEAGHRNIYLYEYSFIDDNTFVLPFTSNVRGANHCAQSVAVFGSLNMPGYQTVLSEEYSKMIETMRDIWYNFMTTGRPIPADSNLPEWPPVGVGWSPHMSLNQTIELRGPLLEERAKFWEEIYDVYYWTPIPPPPPFSKHVEL